MTTVQDHTDTATEPAAPDPRAEVAAGLRELAAWIETQPADLPLPLPAFKPAIPGDDTVAPAKIARIAEAFGAAVETDDHAMRTGRRFGPVLVEVFHVWDRAMQEYDAKAALRDGARWHVFCHADGGSVDLVPAGEDGYATEATAVAVRTEHVEAGCTAGHVLRLISGPVSR